MLLKQRCQSVRPTSQAIPRMALLPDMASKRRCHIKQFYCRNAVTRLCSTFVFSMP